VKNSEYAIIWGLTLLGLFLIVPFAIIGSGLGLIKAWGFAIASAALIADGYLTKACLKVRCKELNPTFPFLKRKIGENYGFILSRLAGFAILVFVLLLFNDAVLLIFATSFLVGVVANSMTLVRAVGDYVDNPSVH
jgi:hypothetical protein